jgi:predicted phosphodiesterase
MVVPIFPFNQSITLLTLSDIHYGCDTHEEKAFLHVVDFLKKAQVNSNPVYYCGIGDFLENITAECVADPYSQKQLPHQQMEYLVDLLKPLKKKGLFAVFGNHENRTRKRAYYDLMVSMCDRLGIKYLGLGGYVRLQVGKQLYTVAVQHGEAGGANWELEMKRMRNIYPDADIYLLGHTHDVIAEYRPYISIGKDGGEIEGYKIFCRCGSFCGYPNYARQKMYEKKATGTLRIKFHANKKLITVEKMIYINGELIEV